MTHSRSILQRICDPFRLPGRRSWFLVQPYSRGDTFLTCALMTAFRSVHGAAAEEIVLLIKESHAPIPELFPGFEPRIGLLPDAQLDDLAQTLQRVGVRGRLIPDEAVIVHPMHMDDGRLDALTQLPGFSQKSMYQHLLGLPLDSEVSEARIPESWRAEARALVAELGMPKGRSVILMPDANSYPAPDSEFWSALSRRLIQDGWTVYTNVFGSSRDGAREPFAGTIPIRPSLRALLPLAEHAGWVISTLTGGMNILISSRTVCRKTVIARGPAPGEKLRFNDEIELSSAFPYAAQATFDGESYEMDEFEFDPSADHAELVERVCSGHNAQSANPPSSAPLRRFIADIHPGDLLDRITILEIKESLLSGASVLHNIRRELTMLRRSLGDSGGSLDPLLAELVAELKRTNQEAWDTNEEIFKGFRDDFGADAWKLDAGSAADLSRAESMVKAFRRSQSLNRARVVLKNKINEHLATGVREEKSYDEPELNISTAGGRKRPASPTVSAPPGAGSSRLLQPGELRDAVTRLLTASSSAAPAKILEAIPG